MKNKLFYIIGASLGIVTVVLVVPGSNGKLMQGALRSSTNINPQQEEQAQTTTVSVPNDTTNIMESRSSTPPPSPAPNQEPCPDDAESCIHLISPNDKTTEYTNASIKFQWHPINIPSGTFYETLTKCQPAYINDDGWVSLPNDHSASSFSINEKKIVHPELTSCKWKVRGIEKGSDGTVLSSIESVERELIIFEL